MIVTPSTLPLQTLKRMIRKLTKDDELIKQSDTVMELVLERVRAETRKEFAKELQNKLPEFINSIITRYNQ